MILQPTKPSTLAPPSGCRTPRAPGDVAQPMRQDARRRRTAIAA